MENWKKAVVGLLGFTGSAMSENWNFPDVFAFGIFAGDLDFT